MKREADMTKCINNLPVQGRFNTLPHTGSWYTRQSATGTS